MRCLSPKKYVVVIAALVGSALMMNAVISLIAIRYNLVTWRFASLFSYQVEKLAKGAPIDLLLVGDSSLGNAVDAYAWSSAEGLVVVNAALTGSYGYAGTLQMLRRAEAARGVKTAVIMQASDTMIRPVSHEGALFSASNFKVFLDVPPTVAMSWLLSKDIPVNVLMSLWKPEPDHRAEMVSSDYMPQGKPLTSRQKERTPYPARFEQDKIFYLKQIVEFCRSNKIDCVYAHGPVIDPLCKNTNGYYTAINERIRGTGISLLSEVPPCIPPDEVGDSVDHVIPSVKPKYTEVYRHMFAEFEKKNGRPFLSTGR